ncbi:hypothetical protein [Streptomyces sp. NPDC005865]|uniref:hypothetical protein n=1 Tax=Streptomyces sp. NPDC005865 TaxID=3155453 RepID=UPI003408BFB3
MTHSIPARRRHLATPALLLCAALALTACGSEKAGPSDPAAPPPAATPTGPTSPASAPGPSPYVDPGVVDGAPHEGENNAYRRPGEMSPADLKDAQAEAARIEPVLKRLWKRKTWDPDSVRNALTEELGYEERRTTGGGKLLGGELEVRAMYERYENGESVTPEGARIGLYVGDHGCVTAFVQETNYEASAGGRFPETGCLSPPVGH